MKLTDGAEKCIQVHVTQTNAKRFNLWLPAELWKRLERYVSRRQREVKDARIEPTGIIRTAIEQHLDAAEKRNG